MIYIGNHVSSSKGFEAMGKQALSLGGDTFAFFTRNPRGGKAKDIDEADVKRLKELMAENHFGKLVAHAPYTMNVCAAKDSVREFSVEMLADDLKRMEYLPGNYYNFHPGSHVGQGAEKGISLIADALNLAISPSQSTVVLLETMAGKGSEIGGRFEELREIIDRVECKDKIGVCFDTCHTWDAGYNLADIDSVLTEFDKVIGIDKLCAVHFNDSMNVNASHKDRHQKIGEGEIGADILKSIARHSVLQNKPFILETPNEDEGYKHEISLIRSWF